MQLLFLLEIMAGYTLMLVMGTCIPAFACSLGPSFSARQRFDIRTTCDVMGTFVSRTAMDSRLFCERYCSIFCI